MTKAVLKVLGDCGENRNYIILYAINHISPRTPQTLFVVPRALLVTTSKRKTWDGWAKPDHDTR
jgi:hypothetical protein